MRTPLGAGGTTAAKEFFRKQQVEEQHSTGRVWSTGATALKRKTSQVAKAAEEGMASREQAVIPVIHPPSGEGADSPSPSFDPPEDGDGGTQAPSSSLAQRRGQFLSDTDLEDIDSECLPPLSLSLSVVAMIYVWCKGCCSTNCLSLFPIFVFFGLWL